MNRKPLVVGAIALTLLGLSACTNTTGAAGYVGDDRIPVSQVQQDSTEVIAAAAKVDQTKLDPTEVNRRQLNRLITARLIEVEAARRGVTVSDGDVDRLLRSALGTMTRDQFDAQLAASQLVPPSQVDAFARSVALNQKLVASLVPGGTAAAQNAAIIKALGDLSTELGTGVAARYGTWDPADVTVALPPNDLSTPAPAASAPSVTSGTTQSQ